MTDFPPYPASYASQPLSPSDSYVVLVLSGSGSGEANMTRSAALSLEQAQEMMSRIAAGQPTDVLLGPIDFVAELDPGRLIVFRGEAFEVRIARLLFSR